MTMASVSPDRNAAPRMELVGPLAKVSTGKRSACSAVSSVPSFWLRYTGHCRPHWAIPSRSAATVRRASASSALLRMVALSRSRRPSAPMSEESVMEASGHSAESSRPASRSKSARTGENTPVTAMLFSPRARMSAPMREISAGSKAQIGVPSNSTPPLAR